MDIPVCRVETREWQRRLGDSGVRVLTISMHFEYGADQMREPEYDRAVEAARTAAGRT